MPAIASTLATTLLVVVVYFWVVRLVDMNEKEPVWAMSMLFVLGAAASLVLPVIVPPQLLELSVVPSAVLKELAKFGAVGAGIYALTVYGRIRGWQEFNGTMDGVVYGACAGLGFATAAEVRSEVLFGSMALPGMSVGLFAGFGKIALHGLADGVLAAAIGAGIGAATEARSAAARVLLPVAGMVAAVLAHLGYATLAHGDALGGSSGLVRSYLAMALPVIAVVLTVVLALRAERAAIRRQLPSEVEAGVMSADELALLQNVAARSIASLRELFSGRLKSWSGLKLLRNRQVQLALIKEKSSRQRDPEARAEIDQEVMRLRENVLECKRSLAKHGSKPDEVSS